MAKKKLKRRLKVKVKKKKVRKHVSREIREDISKVALPVQLPIGQLLGNYSNRAIISHTRLEFVFDFLLALENQSILASRVITSPQHAKQLYEALEKNIKRYERKFGRILVK